MVELMQGLRLWKNPGNKFAILRVHYTADEDKRSKEWYTQAKAGIDEIDWQREHEINFDQQRSKRVFPSYSQETHFKELTINPYLPIIRGWDFGFRHPACVICQIGENDVLNVLYEILGTDIELEEFIKVVQKKIPLITKIENKDGDIEDVETTFKDFCDPAGTQVNDKSKRTSIEILRAHNIHPIFKKSDPEERARIIRSMLLPRTGGAPGLVVNTACKRLNAGFLGGYHYPEDDNGTSEEPEKDGFYDHLFDGVGYIVYNAFKYRNVDKTRRKKVRYVRRTYDPVTGM